MTATGRLTARPQLVQPATGREQRSRETASATPCGGGAEPVRHGENALIVKTTDVREQMLERSLQEYSAQGWRIETRSEFQATIAKRTGFNYGLNVFLTIITFGIWKVILVRTGGRRG